MTGILRSNGASVPLLLTIFAEFILKVLGNSCNEAGFYCYNCTAVQICVGGVPLGDPVMCPEGYTCDSNSQIECIYGPCRYPTSITTTGATEPFVCWAKGRFADPFNPSKYYICLGNYLEPGKFTILEAYCPNGSTFNDEVKRCEILNTNSIPTVLDEEETSNTADISKPSPDTSIDDKDFSNLPTKTKDSSDDSETIISGKPWFSDNPTSFISASRPIASNAEEYSTSKYSWETSSSSVESSNGSTDIASNSPTDKGSSILYASSRQTHDLASDTATEGYENTETGDNRFTSEENADGSTTEETTVNAAIRETPKTSELISKTTDAGSGSEVNSTFAESSSATSSVYFTPTGFPENFSTTSRKATKPHKRTTARVKTTTEHKHHSHEHIHKSTTAIPSVYCPSPGVYPDVWDCSKYYYCRYHKDHLIVYKRRCSKKKYFSVKYKKCVKKRYSECCD